jgi:hypothetical protein
MHDICGAFVNYSYYTNPSINAPNDGRSRTISATKSSPLQIACLFSRVAMMRDGLLRLLDLTGERASAATCKD